ncbi:flagellar basal body L-ring protein FlgH [Asticcacaulis solisilvae]|uniref:flagellar basal body L-ring protein FlgH n=1 Tax=Asticcacaulis solisilvae TaxID=1217274 RepID=UPI003FD6D674
MNGACRNKAVAIAMILGLAASVPCRVLAEDLYAHGGTWPALASDRAAEAVGDSLTVLIQEVSQASGTSHNTRESGAGLSGQVSGLKHAGHLDASGDYNYSTNGQNGRSDQLVARISVVVDGVLPNGDLHVTGDQLIDLNGEKTRIHLTGRVRRADISNTNTVYSSALADASIVYGGPGPGEKKPGLFSWWHR